DFIYAIGVATYSTSNSTVLANIRYFERTWDEVELREHEELLLSMERRSRRMAELLQDILSHDIKNYNQVVRISAELLKTELAGTEKGLALIDAILKATNGSSELVERAKRFGRILSQTETALRGIDVEQTLQASIA